MLFATIQLEMKFLNKPLFSIILPVYNVEKYIERCINSIQKQTLENYEVLFVDDGSTDKSAITIEKLIQSDRRFRLLKKKNEGSGFARNFGLDYANGKYIYFMDPDDEITINLLSDNYELLKNGNLNVVMFGFKTIDESSGEIKEYKNNKSKKNLDKDEFREELLEFLQENSYSAVWNKIYKKAWLADTNVRFTNMKNVQDGQFNCELLNFMNGVGINPKVYYKYYINRPQSATTRYNEAYFTNELRMIQTFEKIVKEWECGNKYQRYISEYKIGIAFNDVKFLLRRSDVKKATISSKNEKNLLDISIEDRKIYSLLGYKPKIKFFLLKLNSIFLIKLALKFMN